MNGTEGTTDGVHDTIEASEEGGKTTAKLRSFNTRGILTDYDQFEELEEIAVIEEVGHEVRLSVQAVLHKAHLLYGPGHVIPCVGNDMEEKAQVIMFEFPIIM
jgi:hypothetical protein